VIIGDVHKVTLCYRSSSSCLKQVYHSGRKKKSKYGTPFFTVRSSCKRELFRVQRSQRRNALYWSDVEANTSTQIDAGRKCINNRRTCPQRRAFCLMGRLRSGKIDYLSARSVSRIERMVNETCRFFYPLIFFLRNARPKSPPLKR
jgi:hypothetical protein